MAGRGVADVVFCLDISNSMRPCIGALKANINEFVRGLQSGGQLSWDLRLDFLAHWAARSDSGGVIMSMRSIRCEAAVDELYDSSAGGSAFFTARPEEFQAGLAALEVGGDEATLIALDTALDFPWRSGADCHRVVIVMTDEPIEDGMAVETQVKLIPELIDKIQALRAMIFVVAPQSAAFDQLCAVDKSEYQVVDPSAANRGLSSINFSQLLGQIGKSISVSQTSRGAAGGPKPRRALFGQDCWVAGTGRRAGD